MRHFVLLILSAAVLAACGAQEQTAGLVGPSMPDNQAQGPSRTALRTTSWVAYQTFDFNSAAVDVAQSDMPKVYDIVEYLRKNPSLDVAIDGTLDAQPVNDADRVLGNRRAASVRHAFMEAGAGIASYKIFTGAYGDSARRHPGHVQILVGPRAGSSEAAL